MSLEDIMPELKSATKNKSKSKIMKETQNDNESLIDEDDELEELEILRLTLVELCPQKRIFTIVLKTLF